jgi:hypothetical protein
VNLNPHQARVSKKRRRKPGNLLEVQRVLWTALCEAERVLLSADDADEVLRAVHAISQASMAYLRLLETGEFEARLAAVETALQKGRT